ncbi:MULTISPECIES: TolC family protein [Elizabethkingia]|nr:MULTISPECIES: TolC family protein [Elizabethkingia]MCL1032503.1 TolC family protein [Elizabethkingia anophelis]MCT3646038.1 TolC family protein [Elizabethkingia anophelis]MCT3653447.1 TolC family protein [Elizabethkingia anophelis]MCT3657214.1 TolC family protein [Elizabethkingia anophelis]MCT3660687.1 TolC family protein [Elizabethkingia anophelis]
MKKCIPFFLMTSVFVYSQQRMSLEECEESFQKNNLQLLAAQYNISEAEADIIQAKIWDLPNLSVELNAIDPENKKIFHIGSTGAKEVGIEQLFVLGRKRKNEIAFARSNKEIAEMQFQGLLVDLRSQLRSTFYNILFEQKKEESLDVQLKYFTDLLNAYKVQTQKGNVSLKDMVRLQALVINVQNDKIEVSNNIIQQKQTLKLLTGSDTEVLPELSDEDMNQQLEKQPLISISELQQKALENNADYLTAKKITQSSELNLKWQKSLSIPDLTIGTRWTQRGAAFDNQLALSFGIPIPLWNKNKGNQMKAEYQIQENKKTEERLKQELTSQVDTAYQTWKNQYQQYFSLKPQDLQDMETVYNGILKNFRKGNISLIEFTDFMESYKQSILQIYEIQKHIITSAEEINRLTQSKIFY